MISNFSFKDYYKFNDLVEIINCLRAPGGCPWDAEQTHESIKKNLIEETYEVIEAINKCDSAMLCEELGDLLMQVVFHAQMETENGKFSIDDVADEVCKKLIERHPHVFGETNVNSVNDVLTNWDAIKRKSKGHIKTSQAMQSVPKELPSLMRSAKIQKKAADCGFDWLDISGAVQKLDEEINELKEALIDGNADNTAEELGDVLFSVVNVSRFAGHDAEEVLTAATDKFMKRFETVERIAAKESIDMKTAGLEKLNFLWDIAKQEKE
jgi:tetrapyrrole methylase family protein / MazG family protein